MCSSDLTLRKSDVKLDEEEHGEYQKRVGKLINLADNSRPDIPSPVREVARHGSDPSPAHMNKMLQIMRYCVDTNEYGLSSTHMENGMARQISFSTSPEGVIQLMGVVRTQ